MQGSDSMNDPGEGAMTRMNQRNFWLAVCLGSLCVMQTFGQVVEVRPRRLLTDRILASGHLLRAAVRGDVPLDRENISASPRNPAGIEGGYWSTLAAGMNAVVNTIAVRDTDVFAGGFFTDAGGYTANYIARWNGTRWYPLGSGVNGFSPAVYAITVSGTNVYGGGVFVTAGGQASKGIARWDGTTWHSLGGGVDGSVYAIAVAGTDVYVGGYFTSAGGVPAENIARWDGSSWHALGAGLDNVVRSITVYQGQVVAAGDFDSSATMPVNFVAHWDGSLWQSQGGGTDFSVYSLVAKDDTLYAGGVFQQAGGVPANNVARWNGSTWSPLGSGVNSIVYALALSDAGLFVGGLFTEAGGAPANQTARWDGAAWSTQYGGVNNVVFAAGARGTDVYLGGAFTIAGAQPASRIARWKETNNSILALAGGWNLVSLPRIAPSNDPDILFAGRTGALFAFNHSTQNYESPSALGVGSGYWVKYDVATAVTISGSDLDSTSLTAAQPGWVLVGSLTNPIPTSSLRTVPTGSIDGLVFRYNRSTQGYEPAFEITSGEGYWVKVTQPCTIRILP
jgi:hypothetical protein